MRWGREDRQEGKRYGMIGLRGTGMSKEVRHGIITATETAYFMMELCMDHFTPFQDLLRAQPGQTTHYNLLDDIIALLVLDADSSISCANFSEEEHEMCCWILRFLVAATHGPCPGNQRLVAESEIVNATIMMIPAEPCPAEQDEIVKAEGNYRSLSMLACDVLEACKFQSSLFSMLFAILIPLLPWQVWRAAPWTARTCIVILR